jgi:hypothetical protein
LGAQQGTALGFWGIGFSVFLPPVMSFGFIGYALFATATADEIQLWPPNRPPVVSDPSPADGAVDVPVDLSELSFRIEDPEGEPMNYTVTTNPNIGSDSGVGVSDGTFNVDVGGLNSNTEYFWHVVVSDGEDVSEESFSFHTAVESPFVYDPIPVDGDDWASVDLSELSFRLEDLQGDLMDYSVETSPDIGSGSGSGVVDGTFSVSVGGLDYSTDYTWFVNVTDGTFWTRRFFVFKTQPMMVFDPFEEGWQYRKQIVVNHSLVVGDLVNFPVLVSTDDLDLRDKAQFDGDDVLFMDGSGVANRLLHEIEFFNGSSGKLVAWVNVSSVSSSVDTVFYLYYGNSDCGSQQVPWKVWNSNYKAVWHLNNNPTGSIFDSSANDNNGAAHGSMSSSNLIEGKVGKCLQFDGVDDYVGVPDSSSLCPINITVSGWYKPLESAGMYVISKGSFDYWGNADGHTYGFMISTDNSLKATFERKDSQQHDIAGNFYTSLNQWYYLTLTYDETANIGSLYVNSVLQGTVSPCHSSVLWYNKPWDFIIGASRKGEGSSKIPNSFQNCGVDEVHVLNTVKTSGWISTEYNNQNNSLNFLSFGLEETPP